MVSVLPAITASAFRVTLSGCFRPSACVSTASSVATSACCKPPRHADVVEDCEAGVIGDTARLAPEDAESYPAQPRGERQCEKGKSAQPVLPHHEAKTLAIREPLALGEVERVA